MPYYSLLKLFLLILVIGLVFFYFFLIKTTPDLQKADAIVLLGNPINDDGTLSMEGQLKVKKAEELLKKNMADCLIITGGSVQNEYIESEGMAKHLTPNLIPSDKILLEKQSQTTVENALYSWAFIDSLEIKNVIVVTIPFHTRRSSEIFGDLPQPLNVQIVSAYKLRENYFFRNVESFIREILAYVYYLIFGYKIQPQLNTMYK